MYFHFYTDHFWAVVTTATQVDGEFYHAINPETTSVYLFKKLQALQNPALFGGTKKYLEGRIANNMRSDLYLFWIGYSNHCFCSTTLQPCFRCTLLILKRSNSVMFVASSHFLESCPKQYLPLTRCWLRRIESSTIPMSMSSAGAPENSNGRDIWWGLFWGG